MQDIQLENVSRHPKTLILPHEFACSETRCTCVRQKVVTVDHDPKTGDRSPRARHRRMPHSIQLFGAGRPGSKSAPLSPAVLRCPDVAKAIRLGHIKSVVAKVEAPAVAVPPVEETQPTTTEAAPVEETLAVEVDAQDTKNRSRKGS